MEIVRKDFSEIYDQVSDHYLNRKADSFITTNGETISKDSFGFGLGAKGHAKIVPGPMDDLVFENYDLGTIFHILMAAVRLLFTGPKGSDTISLDKLLNHWNSMAGIEQRFKTTDWYYEYSDDHRVWSRGSENVKQFVNDLEKHNTPSEKALLESLWKMHVPEYSVRMPDFLHAKKYVMNSEDFAFNQKQYKNAGMLDYFNADVIEKMNQGDQRIRHDYPAVVDGEKVPVSNYLNKAKEANRYFLNKFDLERTRPNGTTVKQTFYNNSQSKPGEDGKGERVQQHWTLKRAYNFLAGRPLYDRLNDRWSKINFGKKLKNGNYGTDYFDKNYGFDLRYTMRQYSFADVGNIVAMGRIAEGFERGNLQKAKLATNDGKVDEYYLAVSIRTSSFKVFDKDKTEVPLEVQVEKGIISKELSEKLKQVYGQKQMSEQKQLTQGGEKGAALNVKNEGESGKQRHGHRQNK